MGGDRAEASDASPSVDLDVLVERALAARIRAYAPYSKYLVGCAIQAGGVMFDGVNVENASYGLTVCAERTAIGTAVCAGHRELEAVVVVTQSSPPAAPCGMCLQTISEFTRAPSTLPIVLVNTRGERREFTLADLLPYGFDRDQLEG